MKVKVFFFFILCCANFFCATYAAQQKQVSCTKSLEKRMDLLVAKIITVGNTGRKFPENEQQLSPYCNETFGLIKTVKDYVKSCMQNLAKQVSSVLMYTIETQMKSLCKVKSRRRDELIDAAACANRGNKQMQKCIGNYIDAILGAKNTDDSLKIPHLCCQYQDIKDCIIESGKHITGCTEKHADTIGQFVDSLAGNILDMLCGDYNSGSDKCANLGPPPKKQRNQRRSKSILVPIVDLLSSFPEV